MIIPGGNRHFNKKVTFELKVLCDMQNFELKKRGEFEYIEEGEGEVILLLHGLFGQLSNFFNLIKYFSRTYKVVVPSLPLYSVPVKDATIQCLSDFLHRFTGAMNYNRMILVGNSMGGHVGLLYTVAHPEKVNKLILTGSSGLYENSFSEGYPRRGDYEYIERKVRLTFYDPVNATRDLVDECYALINDKEKLFRILSLARSAIRDNMAKQLPGIAIPVCLIWGKNDIITPPDVATEFNKLLPHSKLYWIDRCGHAPMMEYPDTFNEIMEGWLTASVIR